MKKRIKFIFFTSLTFYSIFITTFFCFMKSASAGEANSIDNVGLVGPNFQGIASNLFISQPEYSDLRSGDEFALNLSSDATWNYDDSGTFSGTIHGVEIPSIATYKKINSQTLLITITLPNNNELITNITIKIPINIKVASNPQAGIRVAVSAQDSSLESGVYVVANIAGHETLNTVPYQNIDPNAVPMAVNGGPLGIIPPYLLIKEINKDSFQKDDKFRVILPQGVTWDSRVVDEIDIFGINAYHYRPKINGTLINDQVLEITIPEVNTNIENITIPLLVTTNDAGGDIYLKVDGMNSKITTGYFKFAYILGKNFTSWTNEPVIIKDPSKKWTITFSQPIDFSHLYLNIYMYDGNNNRAFISIDKTENPNTLTVSLDGSTYKPGEIYKLFIMDKVRPSNKGPHLKKPIVLYFKLVTD